MASRRMKSRRPRARRPTTRRRRSAQQKSRLARPRRASVKTLRPIIETKKFTGYKNGVIPGPTIEYLTTTGTGEIKVVDAFMNMQATNMDTVIPSSSLDGNDLFSRYLSTKVRLEYPANNMSPPNTQVRPVELVWGWCRPLTTTTLTDPSKSTISRTQILEQVRAQIAEDFDATADDMLFNTKRVRCYTIIGRKKLWPNNNKSVFQNSWVPDLPSGYQQKGGPPPIMTTISWPMNKKVEYTKSDNTGTGGSAEEFVYPNQAYVPWFLFYNPDFAQYSANSEAGISQVAVTTNSCHWFYDA